MATLKEIQTRQKKFKDEVKTLYDNGISIKEIAELKKLTTARIYQILGLNKFKKTK